MIEKQLPKRKNIRLRNYDYSSNGMYFVTICTEHRKTLLSTIVGGDDLGTPKESFSNLMEELQKNIYCQSKKHINR